MHDLKWLNNYSLYGNMMFFELLLEKKMHIFIYEHK